MMPNEWNQVLTLMHALWPTLLETMTVEQMAGWRAELIDCSAERVMDCLRRWFRDEEKWPVLCLISERSRPPMQTRWGWRQPQPPPGGYMPFSEAKRLGLISTNPRFVPEPRKAGA